MAGVIGQGAGVVDRHLAEPVDVGRQIAPAQAIFRRFDQERVMAVLGPVIARRLVGTWFGIDDKQAYQPSNFPVCIRRTSEIDYSGFPCMDGWTVKIMPPVNYLSDVDPSAVDRTVSYADTAIMRRVASTLLEGLDPQPVRSGVYLDGFTGDDRPVIDFHPATKRIVIATGFSGHGYKMSPAIGVAVADLIERDGDPYINQHFSLERTARQAG